MDPIAAIRSFLEDQYVLERGDVRGNVETLFAEDLVYHVDGRRLSREDLIAIGAAVRAIPRAGRHLHVEDLHLDGDLVRWRLRAELPGMGPDGGVLHQDSDIAAVLGADGRVHEVWSSARTHPA